ncbi:hypothetical protein BS614_11700 [Paenibacillus xylanexedens]|uniref:hypothetical protein n=1 Tax=Paenibacillus xylanexedens TaxID=528191 RepID=UPI0009383883|nr:hypothetical protein [Paenibacillus xylanexedens]APO44595.1 hypothetical protein BS614_11700 [Paenibacillus xylanexedens]
MERKYRPLQKYSDPAIRDNGVLGLAYIARTKENLEKHKVKPIILKELKQNHQNEGRVKDAIDDVNLYMKWEIGISKK